MVNTKACTMLVNNPRKRTGVCSGKKGIRLTPANAKYPIKMSSPKIFPKRRKAKVTGRVICVKSSMGNSKGTMTHSKVVLGEPAMW